MGYEHEKGGMPQWHALVKTLPTLISEPEATSHTYTLPEAPPPITYVPSGVAAIGPMASGVLHCNQVYVRARNI